jgi:hypothetical protein
MPEVSPQAVQEVLEAVAKQSPALVLGAHAGLSSAAQGLAAPQHHGARQGAFNASSKFFNGAGSYHRHHKSIAGAIGAGVAAVAGHGVVLTAVVAAAPVVAVAGAVTGAVLGVAFLGKKLWDKL